ncbi:hypothetical protein E4T56_gene15239 [Termitomyces sp. T112]|nr:hypothetical protein E4T56_gene15239 [Termitomyces sp. T112]
MYRSSTEFQPGASTDHSVDLRTILEQHQLTRVHETVSQPCKKHCRTYQNSPVFEPSLFQSQIIVPSSQPPYQTKFRRSITTEPSFFQSQQLYTSS